MQWSLYPIDVYRLGCGRWGSNPRPFDLDVKPPNPPGSQKKLLSRKTKEIVSKLVKSHYVSAGVDLQWCVHGAGARSSLMSSGLNGAWKTFFIKTPDKDKMANIIRGGWKQLRGRLRRTIVMQHVRMLVSVASRLLSHLKTLKRNALLIPMSNPPGATFLLTVVVLDLKSKKIKIVHQEGF